MEYHLKQNEEVYVFMVLKLLEGVARGEVTS